MSAKIACTWKKLWCLCPKGMCSCAVANLCIFCTLERVTGCDKHSRQQAKAQFLVCREFNCPGQSCCAKSEVWVGWTGQEPGWRLWAHSPVVPCSFPFAASLRLEHLPGCHSNYCRFHLVAAVFLPALLTLSLSSSSDFALAFTSKPKIPRTPDGQSSSPRKGKVPGIAPQFSQSGPQQSSHPSSSGSTRSRQSKWKMSWFCLSFLGWERRERCRNSAGMKW